MPHRHQEHRSTPALLHSPALSSFFLATCLLLAIFFVLFIFKTGIARAEEIKAPGWEVTSTTYPTNLAPSGGTGTIEVNVYNIGAAPSSGTVTVTDELPTDIVATEAGDIQGAAESIGETRLWDCSGIGTSVVTCTNTALLPSLPIPLSLLETREPNPSPISATIEHIGIAVKVETAKQETLTNHVTVAGGGASVPASASAPVTVSSTPASSFEFQDSRGWSSSPDGTVDTRAGSHPYEFTYSFDLNTTRRHPQSPSSAPHSCWWRSARSHGQPATGVCR